jgi:DNA ligase (NAD+)
MAIDGVGDIVAHAVVTWFGDKQNRTLFARLLTHLTLRRAEHGTALQGTTFVFTGTLSQLSREEAGALVKARGGSVVSSVSKATSYVVVGENPGSKADTAHTLGVPILTETAFLSLIKAS